MNHFIFHMIRIGARLAIQWEFLPCFPDVGFVSLEYLANGGARCMR